MSDEKMQVVRTLQSISIGGAIVPRGSLYEANEDVLKQYKEGVDYEKVERTASVDKAVAAGAGLPVVEGTADQSTQPLNVSPNAGIHPSLADKFPEVAMADAKGEHDNISEAKKRDDEEAAVLKPKKRVARK